MKKSQFWLDAEQSLKEAKGVVTPTAFAAKLSQLALSVKERIDLSKYVKRYGNRARPYEREVILRGPNGQGVFLERGGLMPIVGDTNVGKSPLVLQIGMMVALKGVFAVRKPLKSEFGGLVLHLTSEENWWEVQEKQASLLASHNVDDEERVCSALDENYAILALGIEDYLFQNREDARGVEMGKGFRILEAAVEKLKPDLVIVDSLSTSSPVDFNSRENVNLCFNPLRAMALKHRFGAIIVGHGTKERDKEPFDYGHFEGSVANIRAVRAAVAVSFQDGESVIATLKANNAPAKMWAIMDEASWAGEEGESAPTTYDIGDWKDYDSWKEHKKARLKTSLDKHILNIDDPESYRATLKAHWVECDGNLAKMLRKYSYYKNEESTQKLSRRAVRDRMAAIGLIRA